jgi:hypothetical protein
MLHFLQRLNNFNKFTFLHNQFNFHPMKQLIFFTIFSLFALFSTAACTPPEMPPPNATGSQMQEYLQGQWTSEHIDQNGTIFTSTVTFNANHFDWKTETSKPDSKPISERFQVLSYESNWLLMQHQSGAVEIIYKAISPNQMQFNAVDFERKESLFALSGYTKFSTNSALPFFHGNWLMRIVDGSDNDALAHTGKDRLIPSIA